MRRVLLATLVVAALPAMPMRADAQRDTIGYGELLSQAANADPRQRQLRLQEEAAALRLRNIAADRRPAFALDGQAQYQSAVTTVPIAAPGVSIPTPPHDTYDAHVGADAPLLDPTLTPRRQVERARLAESRAQVRATLFALRQEVTDAFFTAVGLQERMSETDAAIADLSARLREMVVRYREGAALRGDTAAIAATLDERRQDRLVLAADRGAALTRLGLLTGRAIAGDAMLVSPATAALVAEASRALDSVRTRPEFEQFAATRQRLDAQSRLASAQERPRVSAFARLGYGRPGLNALSSDFQSYWLAGVRLHWSPFDWGTTSRDQALLALEREVVATNEAAFARFLERQAQPALATIARLDSTLALDERIIALREQVAREARAQLGEGVITSATYVDRSTDLLVARLRRVQHRVALDQARATLLNTLGVEVR